MDISLYSFVITGAMGVPLLALVLWANRTPAGWSAGARVAACLIAALAITPTVIAPFERNYVEAASIVIFCGLIGLLDPPYCVYLGVLPVILVTALLYMVWSSRQRHQISREKNRLLETTKSNPI